MSKAVFDRDELYRLLTQIPKGMVTTYGVLAKRLGDSRWARAVGNALHKNIDGDKFPCYKVVNSRGYLVQTTNSAAVRRKKSVWKRMG